MDDMTDRRAVENQYGTKDCLNARIRLHNLYTVASEPFYAWVFDRIPLKSGTRLIEFGCGDGTLWRANQSRIPEGAHAVLTDLSEGMLNAAKDAFPGASLMRADAAEGMPFADESFDVAVADHMLYHLPDPGAALDEARRILRKGGALIASTAADDNMLEFWELVRACTDGACAAPRLRFSLDNGEEMLKKRFSRVERMDYESHLFVTDAARLADYARSMLSLSGMKEEAVGALEKTARAIIAREGGFRIRKTAGLFRAVK